MSTKVTRDEVIASLVDLLRPHLSLQVRLNVSDRAMLAAADHYLSPEVARDHREKYEAADE